MYLSKRVPSTLDPGLRYCEHWLDLLDLSLFTPLWNIGHQRLLSTGHGFGLPAPFHWTRVWASSSFPLDTGLGFQLLSTGHGFGLPAPFHWTRVWASSSFPLDTGLGFQLLSTGHGFGLPAPFHWTRVWASSSLQLYSAFLTSLLLCLCTRFFLAFCPEGSMWAPALWCVFLAYPAPLLLICCSTSSWFVLSHSASLLIVSGHHILRILLRHLFTKVLL